MLISSCAVVNGTLTGCGRKLKAPVVKGKSFKLEWKGGKFFQADQQKGEQMGCFLRWLKIEPKGTRRGSLTPFDLQFTLLACSISCLRCPCKVNRAMVM